jgi:acylglycerol lipase
MKHHEGTFKGVRKANIFYEAWLPDKDVKAVLLIVHGLGEHCRRYVNVVNHFVPLGYAVYGLDHLGHGKSDGEREVIERFSDYTDTLKTYFEMVKVWQPGKPIFLYGHSLGGLIAIDYLLDHQASFTGAIISAPLIKVPANITPVTVILAKVMSLLAPKMGFTDLDASGVSRDPEVVKAYVNDPLVFHGKTPARLGVECLKAMQHAVPLLGSITLPLLAIQGSADKLADPTSAQLVYDRVGSTDKSLKVYPGCYHEVHNEPERMQLFKDLEAWLKAHQ